MTAPPGLRWIGLLLLSACSNLHLRPLPSELPLRAADFGPAAIRQPWLGPLAEQDPILITFLGGLRTHQGSKPTRIGAAVAVRHLNGQIGELNPNDPTREALRQTRARILAYYQNRRIAHQAVPPYTGRGAMTRMMMSPNLMVPKD